MRTFLVSCLFLASWGLAQTTPAATPPPQRHVPPSVMMELRTVESAFDLALSRDCAPERCSSKGCLYVDHVSVDLPRSNSLPGLGQPEGPGSVPPQEYLTQARCDFAHEKSVAARDVDALVRRLEQRLSKGWLKVQVTRHVLDPISPGLAKSPEPPPPPEPPKKEEPVAPPAPLPPGDLTLAQAVRELWAALLPHFSWMIAILFVTAAAMTLIWAARRLGRDSLEDKALLAQLASGSSAETVAPAEVIVTSPGAGEWVAAQRTGWESRLNATDLASPNTVMSTLLSEWVRAGEYSMVAKAIHVFGDRLSEALPTDAALAGKKVELASFLKTVDADVLPTDEVFFRTLQQQAVASSVMAQPDAAAYRGLSEEFGETGLGQLIERLPPRQGALLFGLLPMDTQGEVARLLSPALRQGLANQLLLSSRAASDEREALFAALEAARGGQRLPAQAGGENGALTDRGQAFDAASALSVLLSTIEPADRQLLFERAQERSGGVLPRWYEDILAAPMLSRLPAETRNDVVLEVDARHMAAWLSLQPASWREGLVSTLPASLQTALRANAPFAGRDAQLLDAKAAQSSLVSAVKRRLAAGTVDFMELVA